MREIQKQIKTLRKSRGMTQQQLADEIGTIQNGVSRIESCRIATTTDQLEKIGDVLGYKLAWVECEKEEGATDGETGAKN